MRILAIDPGYGRCGVAVLERNDGGKETLLYSDCIETSADAEFAERLGTVANECTRLSKKYKPDVVALEKLYFSTNQRQRCALRKCEAP
jgi:crossover junction endodeoxyribonuclease RuvC